MCVCLVWNKALIYDVTHTQTHGRWRGRPGGGRRKKFSFDSLSCGHLFTFLLACLFTYSRFHLFFLTQQHTVLAAADEKEGRALKRHGNFKEMWQIAKQIASHSLSRWRLCWLHRETMLGHEICKKLQQNGWWSAAARRSTQTMLT